MKIQKVVDSLLEKNRELDPFYKINTFEKCVEEFSGELSEAFEAYMQKSDEFEEELGDLYRSVGRMIMKAEDADLVPEDTYGILDISIKNMNIEEIFIWVKSKIESTQDRLDQGKSIAEELKALYTLVTLAQTQQSLEKIYNKMSGRKSFLIRGEEVTMQQAMDERNSAKTAEGKGNLRDDKRNQN